MKTINGRRMLGLAAAVAWGVTLLMAPPGDVVAIHCMLIGLSASLLAGSLVAYITEARRAQGVEELSARLCAEIRSNRPALDEVLKYGLRIGEDQGYQRAREELGGKPILLTEFKARKHCGPECPECHPAVTMAER